jgi:16S rRNA (guanine966-N2)-methyltransferase
VRPTSGRVREALFSILGQDLSGLHVLDLCAGAGSLGIEAASRGARRVVFVEQARDHLRVLRENAALLEGRCEVVVRQGDARSALGVLAAQGERFDLVFLDPPYGKGLADELLTAIEQVAGQLLAVDAVVVVESEKRAELKGSVGQLTCQAPRGYGDSKVWIYRAAESGR